MFFSFVMQGFNLAGSHYVVLVSSKKEAWIELNRLSELPIIKTKQGAFYLTSPFKQQELIEFTDRLSTLIKAGLTLIDALSLLKKEEKKPYWQAVFYQLIDALTQGESFSCALKRYPQLFPTLYHEIIAMSELTGNFEFGLTQLAMQFKAQNDLKKRIHKALRYPLFLFAMTLLACTLLLLFVLPHFSNLYANFNAELPKITALLIGLSNLLQHCFFEILLILLAFLVFFWGIKKYCPLVFEQVLLKLPFMGLILKTAWFASFFQTLAITQQHQVALSKALQTSIKTVKSIRFQNAIFAMQHQIEQGLTLSEAVKKQSFFPDLCVQLLQIGEETGDLTTQLMQLALYYQTQNKEKSEQFSKSLEPIFMSFMALMVGTLIIAVYLPIFSLGDIL